MAYDENIRIIAEEVERLKNRPTGDTLPEVESTDEGKVLTVNSSGEWDAEDLPNQLPDIEPTDVGKILGIDDEGNPEWRNESVYTPLSYSLEEQNTGIKWVDGKDIYQKTLHKSGGASGQALLPHGVTGMSECIKCEAFCHDSYSDAATRTYTFARIDSGNVNIGIEYVDKADNGNVSIGINNNFAGDRINDFYVTIWYTKTTTTTKSKKKGAN